MRHYWVYLLWPTPNTNNFHKQVSYFTQITNGCWGNNMMLNIHQDTRQIYCIIIIYTCHLYLKPHAKSTKPETIFLTSGWVYLWKNHRTHLTHTVGCQLWTMNDGQLSLEIITWFCHMAVQWWRNLKPFYGHSKTSCALQHKLFCHGGL